MRRLSTFHPLNPTDALQHEEETLHLLFPLDFFSLKLFVFLYKFL
jgi:hypothetical protein